MVDEVDIKLDDLIYTKDNQDRKIEQKPWQCCGKAFSRSLVVFTAQIILIFLVVTVSITKLCLAEDCKETTVWVALLSTTIGYVLPAPRSS